MAGEHRMEYFGHSPPPPPAPPPPPPGQQPDPLRAYEELEFGSVRSGPATNSSQGVLPRACRRRARCSTTACTWTTSIAAIALWRSHALMLRLDKLRSKIPYDERMWHGVSEKGTAEYHCVDDLELIIFVRMFTVFRVFRDIDFFWAGATVRRYTENQVEHTIPFTIRTAMFYHPQVRVPPALRA
eukprot:tig00021179_g19232.t1